MSHQIECLKVRSGHEWATVFLEFGQRCDGKDLRDFGTLCVNSSFGVYGYSFGHCGRPFLEFLQKIDTEYLLRKISRMETCADKAYAALKERIFQDRKDGSITEKQARKAYDTINELRYEGCDGNTFMNAAYREVDIPGWDWDFSAQDWPNEAKGFVAKLWPAIVEELKKVQVTA